MSDIVERLRRWHSASETPPSGPNAVWMLTPDEKTVLRSDLTDAAAEIIRLRSIAGKATVSDGLAGIKRQFVPADVASLSIEKEPFGA